MKPRKDAQHQRVIDLPRKRHSSSCMGLIFGEMSA